MQIRFGPVDPAGLIDRGVLATDRNTAVGHLRAMLIACDDDLTATNAVTAEHRRLRLIRLPRYRRSPCTEMADTHNQPTSWIRR